MPKLPGSLSVVAFSLSPDPTVLLCIFASPRSSVAQIDRLIRYLEEQRDRHRDDPASAQLIEGLLARANQWLAPRHKEYRPGDAAHERSSPAGRRGADARLVPTQ